MVSVIGVNYNTANCARIFIKKWAVHSCVSRIIIVDNFSSDDEVVQITALKELDPRVEIILRENTGYGSALNAGIAHCLKKYHDDEVFVFGNIDITPVVISDIKLTQNEIGMPVVMEGDRNRNPFLTTSQKKLLIFYKLAAKLNSPILLSASIFLNKIFSIIPSRPWAVHGSVFICSARQATKIVPIFSEHVFLYCEEYFYARKIERANFKIVPINWKFEHIGGVSTHTYVGDKVTNKWRISTKFFKIWQLSMLEYFRSQND